jgi:hypothetical protein
VPKQSHQRLSPDEIVAYLKRTSQLTVLVEGSDDKLVYRYLESKLDDLGIDCLDCGGRPSLLSVFNRRAEFPGSPVIYIADKDMWHFTGVPSEYSNGIIFTQGYSIENDLYIKEFFESLLDSTEKKRFDGLIASLARWQAFQVVVFRANGSCQCDFHVNQIAPPPSVSLCPHHLASIAFSEPPDELTRQIVNSYATSLRGKTLFEAILRFLNGSSRPSSFSKANLFEIGAKIPNDCVERLCTETRNAASSIMP